MALPLPFGNVPTEVSLEAVQQAARGTALSMLASLKRDLDRVSTWLMVYGMVNADACFSSRCASCEFLQ
jgi:hypothetical protein